MSFLEITSGHDFANQNFLLVLRRGSNFIHLSANKLERKSFYYAMEIEKENVIKMRDFLNEVLQDEDS